MSGHAKSVMIAVLLTVMGGFGSKAQQLNTPTRERSRPPADNAALDQRYTIQGASNQEQRNQEQRSVILNVFRKMVAPRDENPQSAPEFQGLPTNKAPVTRPVTPRQEPHFTPRLRPPNGKTDGKIYPA